MRVPLTDSQIAVYTYCRAHPDEAAYKISVKFGPYFGIDAQRLKHAAEQAIEAHPILKTRIDTASYGQPAMCICSNEKPVVEIIQSEDCFQDSVSLFGRLYDIAVVDGDDGCSLMVCVHHVIFDGYSMNIFVDDVSTAYLGGTIAPEKKTYFELSRCELAAKTSSRYNNAREYFVQTFSPTEARTIPLPDLSGLSRKPLQKTFSLPIAHERWAAICNLFGQTANIVSISMFAIVLGKFCGENEARFSTVFHGRHGRDAA
ncbi:MAG: hypothetical protein K6F33_03435, partial [Bacteroidales bacterium]|nr:hypothetical protein [Bacteroidales bacterium]